VSRHSLEHPTDPNLYLVAGHDHAVGLFAEVHDERRDKPLHVLDAFTQGGTVRAEMVLQFVVEHGFVSRADLELCRSHMIAGTKRPWHVVPLSYVMAEVWSIDPPEV